MTTSPLTARAYSRDKGLWHSGNQDATIDIMGSMAEAITTDVVRLFAEHTGRGPTTARTNIGADMIIVTLRNVLNASERRLVSRGQQTIVLSLRRIQQQQMGEQLVAIIERRTGRRVEAFLNDTLADPDITVDVFIMHSCDD